MSRLKSRVTFLNMVSTLIMQIVLIVDGFIIPKLILDAFGSDVNGLVSSLTQFLRYIALIDGGIGGVIMAKLYRPLTRHDDEAVSSILASSKRFFGQIGCVFMVYTIIVGVFYPLLFNTGFSFLYVFSLTIILSIQSIIQYMLSLSYKILLTADKKIYVVSFTLTGIRLAEILLAIVCIKVYPEIHFLKFLTSIVFLAQPIIFTYYVKRHYNISKKEKADSKVLKGRWDGFAINTASFIHNSTDVAVLTFFTNLATVSIYSVYALVTNGLKTIISALVSSLNPTLGHVYAKKNYDLLKQRISMYEYIILFLVFFVFGVSTLLITPFVMIYTSGLTDADYCQPFFGVLIILSEALYLLKFPHLNLAYAAGKYKEISRPAFIEAGSNIILSVVLVPFLGIIGVTIGTIVAMIYRMIFHVYYTTKLIPGWRQWFFYRKLIIFTITTLIGIILCMFIPFTDDSIVSWIIHLISYSLIIGGILILTSVIFFRSELGFIKKYLKRR